LKARKVKKLDPAGSLDENAARIIRTRLDELRSFVPEALDPAEVEAQHDMRIAAKRLRYVLEVTGFCFGKPAVAARRRARDLQGLLGEIHDCDVMLPRVQAQIEALRADDARAVLLRAGEAEDLDPRLAARAPHRTAYRGLELLAVHLRARRALLFERFREFWQAETSKGTWARLESAVAAHLRRVRAEREASANLERAREERETAERAEAAARQAVEQARSGRSAAGPG
jgi:CHAD domain